MLRLCRHVIRYSNSQIFNNTEKEAAEEVAEEESRGTPVLQL
jgi:hypothetical protein